MASSIVSTLCCLLAVLLHCAHLYLLFFSIPWCSDTPLDHAHQHRDWLISLVGLTRDVTELRTCVCDNPGGLGGAGLVYVGLPCDEVKRALPILLTLSASLNFVAMFVSAWYAALVALSQRNKTFAAWRSREKEDLVATVPMLQQSIS